MQQALQAGRAEGGSRIALSGAEATGIETEKAQYVRSIISITCGIGFADAAAADLLADITGLYLVRSARLASSGSPQLQPSTWKSSPEQL